MQIKQSYFYKSIILFISILFISINCCQCPLLLLLLLLFCRHLNVNECEDTCIMKADHIPITYSFGLTGTNGIYLKLHHIMSHQLLRAKWSPPACYGRNRSVVPCPFIAASWMRAHSSMYAVMMTRNQWTNEWINDNQSRSFSLC